jgi:hypothetical protein
MHSLGAQRSLHPNQVFYASHLTCVLKDWLRPGNWPVFLNFADHAAATAFNFHAEMNRSSPVQKEVRSFVQSITPFFPPSSTPHNIPPLVWF